MKMMFQCRRTHNTNVSPTHKYFSLQWTPHRTSYSEDNDGVSWCLQWLVSKCENHQLQYACEAFANRWFVDVLLCLDHFVNDGCCVYIQNKRLWVLSIWRRQVVVWGWACWILDKSTVHNYCDFSWFCSSKMWTWIKRAIWNELVESIDGNNNS